MITTDTLIWEVADKLIELAEQYNDLTISDLQGRADVVAREIIEMVRRTNQ